MPDGVYTGREGAVPDQEEDAFCQVAPMEREVPFGAGEAFAIPEGEREKDSFGAGSCRTFVVSLPGHEMMGYAKSVGGSPMSVLAVFMAMAIQRVHPENRLAIRPALPVSVRRVMGNPDSILYQVVHMQAAFSPEELLNTEETELHRNFRNSVRSFTTEASIKRHCAYYRSAIEKSLGAIKDGTLDSMIRERQKSKRGMVLTSYLGTLRIGAYGDRIRMTVFHVMPVRGITVQMAMVGNCFYADWYQGFSDEAYVRAFTEIARAHNMPGAVYESV